MNRAGIVSQVLKENQHIKAYSRPFCKRANILEKTKGYERVKE